MPGDDVIVAGHGGIDSAINAKVSTKREFAGYWEYVLDEAIFTVPAHPNWGGAGLIGPHGELLGIGSLLVQQVTPSGQSAGANMIVPIDPLKPILDDLRMYGRRNDPPRPWMGMLVQDMGEQLVVGSTYAGCPAEDAGLKSGDVILAVDGEPLHDLAKMFRKVWSLGPAGIDVPLTVSREGRKFETATTVSFPENCINLRFPPSPGRGRRTGTSGIPDCVSGVTLRCVEAPRRIRMHSTPGRYHGRRNL